MIAERDYNIDRWLDVDFVDEAKRIGRLLGQNPDLPAALARFGSYEETYGGEIYDPSQWDAIADRLDAENRWCSELVTRIFDQDGEPSCVSNATLQLHQILQALQFGKERVVDLSQISLYMRVGSRSSGSTLTDNLDEMRTIGALPLNTPANIARFKAVMAGNGYGTKYPDAWKDTAKLFRFDEVLRINSYNGFISALLNGRPVVYARRGHCILAVRWMRQRRLVPYVNSWSEEWGERVNDEFAGGLGFDSESTIRSAANGAFTVRSIIVPESVWGTAV